MQEAIEPSTPSTSDPPPRRSTCARVGTCLALLTLLAGAAVIGGKPLLSKAPTLVEEEGQASLVFPGFGSVPLVLGPGCTNLALSDDWDSFHRASLTWLGEGKPCRVRVQRISGPRGVWGAEIQQQWPELGQRALLLPAGQVLIVDAASEGPLLEIERWEGSPGGGRRYVVWVYSPYGEKGTHRVASFDDGHSLGRVIGEGQGAGDGWEVEETYEEGSRKLEVAAGKEFGTYHLEVGGQTEQVVLERTYHEKWSPGDKLPE